MKRSILNAATASIIATLFFADPAWAKTTAWSAAPIFGDQFLSNARNWDNGVPIGDDDVVFQASATNNRLFLKNDLDPANQGFVTLSDVLFQGENWALNDRALGVRHSLTAEGSLRDLGVPEEVRFGTVIGTTILARGAGGIQTLFHAKDGGVLGLSSFDVGINGVELRTESHPLGERIRAHSQINITERISGSGPINLTALRFGSAGRGSLILFTDRNGANDFTGPITIGADAMLRVFGQTALGATTGSTTIGTGGRLHIVSEEAPFFLDEPIVFAGGELRTGATRSIPVGDLTVRSQVSCSGNAIWQLGSDITLEGGIVGATGNHTINGTGFRMTFAGSGSNTTGIVTTGADLFLEKPPGIDAITGGLTVAGGSTVRWVNGNQLADTATLRLREGSVADLDGESETIATLLFSGDGGTVHPRFNGALTVGSIRAEGSTPPRISAPGTLRLGAAATEISVSQTESPDDLTIEANIQAGVAGATLRKTGSGKLLITGVCATSAVIENGSVEVHSISPNMSINLNQQDGVPAVLRGTGTVGSIISGVSGGVIDAGFNIDTTGTLRCGNVAWNGSTRLVTRLRGTTAGTGHDQLIVNGSVNLGGAELVLDFGSFSLAPGTSFTILSNDGSDAITGIFGGLPQGSVISGRFIISYTGGSGNDVTLTAIAPPSGITRTWIGQGANEVWTSAQNWSPSGRPQNGDALLFPPSSPRFFSINNIADLALESITIQGGAYTLVGNGVALANGLSLVGGGNHTVSLPFSLTGAQTFSVGNQALFLSGAIDTNGMPLTFATNGVFGLSFIQCSGIISEGAGDQFRKVGAGVLRLDGANTTRGNFHIAEGLVQITSNTALGSRLGYTSIDAGADLVIAGTDLALNEPLLLAGKISIAANAGTVAITDPIDCAAGAEIFVSATGVPQLNLFDSLTGIALKKSGPGIMQITGAKTKSLSSGINVAEGRLVVSGTAGVIALPGDTTVSGTLEIKQRRVTEADSQLIIEDGGTVICDSPEIAFAAITMTGGTLTTDGNGMSLKGPLTVLRSPRGIESRISGTMTLPDGLSEWQISTVDTLHVDAVLREAASTDAHLSLLGQGRFVFAANNTIDKISIGSAKVEWRGQSSLTKMISSQGKLEIVGTLQRLEASFGDVSIGAGGTGRLTLSQINALSVLMPISINGTTPGTSYDQIRITGDAENSSFGSSLLTVGGSGFTPDPGTVFTIVDVQGSGHPEPFSRHPEGSTLLANNGRYRISYVGGDGNDVTLTALSLGNETGLQFSNLVVTDNAATGVRTFSGSVSGGSAVAGVPMRLELSTDLAFWFVQSTRIADASGRVSFAFERPLDGERLFLRVGL